MFLGKVHLKFRHTVPGCDWPGWHAARINYSFLWLNGFKCSCQSCQSCWNIRSLRGVECQLYALCTYAKGRDCFLKKKGNIRQLNYRYTARWVWTRRSAEEVWPAEALIIQGKRITYSFLEAVQIVPACVICINILIYMYTCKHACTSGFGIRRAFREQAS